VRIGLDACARAVAKQTHSPSINVVGYCLGGTIVTEYLAHLAARGDKLIESATFFASLVDFSDPGDLANFTGEDAIAFVEQKMSERGYLSGREMADTFNMLRANDLIWTVAVNRYLLGKDAPAFDLLYWNDDATRMPAAMHSYYLRHMYANNDLIKPGVLSVMGTPIDVRAIANDCYIVGTAEDHIAPWKSVYRLTQLIAGKATFRLGLSGHIAGIINPPSEKQKGGYWENAETPPDAEAWQASATLHKGSWWPDWIAWLAERSGPMVAPPKMGRTVGDAPGTYVLERS
jgi:polyhydroxyalkanoate synthase